jgi:hypothetical protein
VPRAAFSLTPAGRRFVRDSVTGAQFVGVLEAAQATEIVLDAIARSDGTRLGARAAAREQGRSRHPRQLCLRPQRRHHDGLGPDPPHRRRDAAGHRAPERFQGAVVSHVVKIPARLMR